MRVYGIRDLSFASEAEYDAFGAGSGREEVRSSLRLVLASRSPRRAELLRAAGIEFIIRTADIDETPLPDEAASDYVVRLAREKALEVSRSADEVILGADTTVVLGSEIMGKPLDAHDASRMLRALAGRRH